MYFFIPSWANQPVQPTASTASATLPATSHGHLKPTQPKHRLLNTPSVISGTFSLEGALVCSPCPSGFYSGVRASVCIPCAIGTYRQIDSASGDCDPCAAGTYAPFEQASLCLDCPRGFYSEAGGASACSPCPAGTAGGRIAGGGLADACVDCAAGEYSTADGSMACEQCLAGTASSTVGADNDDVCEVRRSGGGAWCFFCALCLGKVRGKAFVVTAGLGQYVSPATHDDIGIGITISV